MAFKSELLRKKMKEERKTRAFLARLTGKKERTVSRWLNGGNAPKATDLEKIATALNCTAQDFDPRYADEGPGVAVSARVSPASRNALELVRLRYGVTNTQVFELAPVLFSIFAARALAVPAEDEALEREARRLGYPVHSMSESHDNGAFLDRQAAASSLCFGVSNYDPAKATPRNLFFQALSRVCSELGEMVDIRFPHEPDAGEPVTATGFAIEGKILSELTGDDPELIEAIGYGRIRLTDVASEILAMGVYDTDRISRLLRSELEAVKSRQREDMAKRRKASLAKLEAWLAVYQAAHPDLAEEYSVLVRNHCHEDGWAPAAYGEEFRDLIWSDPFSERRFIDESTLPQSEERAARDFRPLSFSHPIVKRFETLEAHRAESKATFKERG